MNQSVFLRIWRKLTPWKRSPTERALIDKDLKFIQSVFQRVRYKFFCFLSIFSEGLSILFPKNKSLFFANDLLEKIDSYLLNLFPFLGKYCAVVVLKLEKDNMV